MSRFFAKKTVVDGITFDSKDEAAYYEHLLADPDVVEFERQPEFEIIPNYKIMCSRCKGVGRLLNKRTGNLNKCSLCNGNGVKTKTGAKYTPDFRVVYKDGTEEVVDVKASNGFVQRDFTLRRKLFEQNYGKALVIMMRKNGKWVRK